MMRIFQIISIFLLSSCGKSEDIYGNRAQEDFIGEITEIATGLTSPWGITFLPDSSILISSRTTAQIYRVPLAGVETRQPRATPLAAYDRLREERAKVRGTFKYGDPKTNSRRYFTNC